jgi:hypothetical protein
VTGASGDRRNTLNESGGKSLVPAIDRKRRAELIRKAFEILLPHPEGLPPKTVLERIAASLPSSESEARTHPARPLRSFEEIVWLATIAPAKAGWLRNDLERWLVTEAGQRAFAEFKDPEEFIAQAGKLSKQGWVSVQFPNFYRLATRTADQLIMDYKLIRRVGPRQLFGKALKGGTAPWQEVLPLQKPRRFKLADISFSSAAEIQKHLDEIGASYTEGGHTIYVPPQTAQRSAFRIVMRSYPADAGLKIIKRGGGVDDSSYILDDETHGRGNSRLQKRFTHDHKHLSLVANLLFVKGLGPRLYDLTEIDAGGHVWTAYVIRHVKGSVPTTPECEAGIKELKELEREGLLRNNIPDGWKDEDFTCPKCNGNALTDEAGKFNYIDFQNFNLVGYETFLRETALEATEKSHFGQNYVLRRGRYLYQSVPGVRLPSRRIVEDRIAVIRRLLEEARVSVADRLVLDVGCNIGMMMAQYLKLGAAWCHGWDRAYLVPHTERLLSALGCTRFSTTGGDIEREQRLDAEVPEFQRDALNGCVVSYLAVRGHLGWLDALGRLPWSFMIYEGHEEETSSDFADHMASLKEMTSFRVAAQSTYKDGDSDERLVAVLVREA